MKRFVGLRALAAAPLLVLACFTLSASGAVAAPPSGTRVMASKPHLPRGAKDLGAVASTATVAGDVVLQPRDEAALVRFISQVTDTHSPLYHHYLAPGAFAAKFGPTSSSIAAVESQLRADGLAVTGVERDGLVLHFTAPATRVESAFRTGLARYRLANGSIGLARTGALRVPDTIAKYVRSVVGLDTTVRLRPASILRTAHSVRGTFGGAKAASFTHPPGSPTPCSDATAAAQSFGGLTDDQIANAYGAFGLYGAHDTGSGQRIAVFELEPFASTDLETFDTCYFGATAATAMASRLQVIPIDGGQPAGAGSGEAILDVQDISAFAPGANIDVYEAPNNTFGAFDAYAKIVNDDVDQIVSTSWGFCEQALQDGSPGVQQAENLLFEQAAAQGQSVFSAAGDEGSDDCNQSGTVLPVKPVLSVDDPASQPYVVAAGGTTIDNPTQPASEHVWNDGPAWGAGGGGISESWAMPSWQAFSHVPGIFDPSTFAAAAAFEANDLGDPGFDFCKSENPGGSFDSNCREVPDVSADADEFTGAVTIYAGAFGGWITTGGTSSAAPLWAAMLADVNESPTCQSNPATQHGVGFVGPLLYAVASTSPAEYAASFNDIKTGNNDAYGDSNMFQATAGYDMASGLGSPQLTQPNGGAGLAFYLCNLAPAVTRPTVTNISPNVASTSAPSPTATITGSGFTSNGAEDVAAVQIGSVKVAPFDVTVTGPTTIDVALPPAAALTSPNDQTNGAGRYQITVTLDNGETSAVNLNSWFTYVDENGLAQALPTVTSVNTYAGPEAGGNVVDVYGVGFTGATGVMFGGVAAPTFTIVDDSQIRVTVPAFSHGTTVCDQDGSSFDPSQNATNDICQTQVVVTSPNGSSATATIHPFFEGAYFLDPHGAIEVPPGEEGAPAATEYDYVPAPTITSISTSGGPKSLASEEGGTVVTIHGQGFNYASLDWVNFGDATEASSQQLLSIVSITGTKIQILAPAFDVTAITVDTATLPVTVKSAAGLSNATSATYAGIPTVTGVEATSGPTAGTPAGPDTGGTPIKITGSGFANQSEFLYFYDIVSPPASFGTQYNLTTNGDTTITTATVSQNPGVVDVQVCTATDCSFPTSLDNDPSDFFFLYPPGDPKIDSITPSSGSALGGTQVTITGENLGCTDDVEFGGTTALDFSNVQALLDCGSTTSVTVTTPPGTVGTVPVTLSTVESDATGAAPATGTFIYTQPPAQALTVHRRGKGTGRITSSPRGISCGKTCTHQFAYGTSVTLKAKAAKGSTFSGWSGACAGKKACKVPMIEATTATARFALADCVVPKVKGKTFKATKAALKARFCSVGKVRRVFSSTVRPGHVVSQRPKARTHLKHRGKVNLVVSRGKHTH